MNPLVQVDGDTGTATSDLLVLGLPPDTGWRISACGRYVDRVVWQEGRWLIARRDVSWFNDIPRAELEPEFGASLTGMLDELLAD